METTYILYFISVLAYICLCIHCSQTGKNSGLKGGEIFLLSFFGTPVIGYLHMILVVFYNGMRQNEIEKETKKRLELVSKKVDLSQYK